jgi:hypothetical protein
MQRENNGTDYRENIGTDEAARMIAGRLESWNNSLCPRDSKESRSVGSFGERPETRMKNEINKHKENRKVGLIR